MGKKLYITAVIVLFAAFVIVFNTFPRSTVSEVEKRELAKFPEFTFQNLKEGRFTKELSTWFSDSEPYRDMFINLSMSIKDWMRMNFSKENAITFHAPDAAPIDIEAPDINSTDLQANDTIPANYKDTVENRRIEEYRNKLTAEENAKIAHAGIIIIGSGDKTRALMAYAGDSTGGVRYAEAANIYKRKLGKKVNIYLMVIPTSIEFYCPDAAKSRTKSQRATINNIFAHLSDSVKAVDVYTTLGRHANEDIYLRTDHHWSPLGAFYAAKKFAQIADVPFKDTTSYIRKVVKRYVGSMYGYSKDISVKKAPEDFVYWEPDSTVTYTTTYINYTIDENYKVTGESGPFPGKYFYHYKDGSGSAYCTFMGGDTKLTKVVTSTKNKRRLIIIKDSFGNALPGYLFFSFEEIHVIDYRYFTFNMVEYVKENKITDILFANNIFSAYSNSITRRYTKFLTQDHATFYPPKPKKAEAETAAPAPASNPEAPAL
jgi:hypothetical protein